MDTAARAPLFTRKTLTALIIPLVIEQFLAMFVGMADTVMVTSAGEAAVSAISLVDSINILLIQIFSALATGGAVVVSQYIGKQDLKSANVAAKQLVYASTAIALVVLAIAFIFQEQILRGVFGSIEDEVMQNCLIYFRLSALSYPFLALYNACAALFRAMGNSKISMFTSFIMNAVNITGNAIMVYIYHMGVFGVALASLVSRTLAAVIIFILTCSKKNIIHLERVLNPEFNPGMIKNILRIGIPNGLENGMFQVGKLTVQSLIAGLGTSSIAANAIMNSICGMINVPGGAIGLGMITVVGQCVGAGEYDQAVKYTKQLMAVAYSAMFVLCLGLFLFAEPIFGMFNLSKEAIATAMGIVNIYCIVNVLIWPAAFPFANALRAAGDAKFTMICSIASMWIFRIGMCYVFVLGMNLGLAGVWYAMYIDWVFRAACFITRFVRGKWRSKKLV